MRPVLRSMVAVAAIVCAVATVGLAGSCGGAGAVNRPDLGPPPAPRTVATLAGPMCEGDACSCAPTPAAAGLPEGAGLKRFELRLGPTPNQLWLAIGDGAEAMQLYKNPQRPNECFYVDLPPGKHRLVLRAHDPDGLAAGLRVRELAKVGAAPSAYDTFELTCGSPGPCTVDALDAFKQGLGRFPRGIHDPCGSVRVRGVTWQTGELLAMTAPIDLQLELVLDVYEFPPKHAHGDAACATDY